MGAGGGERENVNGSVERGEGVAVLAMGRGGGWWGLRGHRGVWQFAEYEEGGFWCLGGAVGGLKQKCAFHDETIKCAWQDGAQ